MFRHLRLLLLLLIFPFAAFSKSTIRLEKGRVITITYKSKSWNLSPEKIDVAFLVFRDATTGRMAIIQLEETAPDSSEFVGNFAITWTDANEISPEIYVPLQDSRTKDQRHVFQMVSSGQLPRKPIIVRKNESNEKVIDVFDNRPQAEAAWKSYQDQLKASSRKLIKPIPDEQNLAAAKQADYQKQMRDLAKQAQEREGDRVRLERAEREKLQKAQEAFSRPSDIQKTTRKAKGKKLFDEGMALYNASNFAGASDKFREALDADPTATEYYFNYGVALYRTDKFNMSMVALRIAPQDPKHDLEKKYFMGLIHLKLKELEYAGKLFDEVAATKDPVLAPSALFYKGVLLFTDGKFEEAKKPFEDVIDTSQDPQLDKQAEEYIEQIANAINFKKMQEQKWTLTGTVGVMYDSNVLLAPDGQVSTTVEHKGDLRLMTMGTAEYRPLFNEHHEMSIKGTANLTNSSRPDLSTADPWIYTFEAPYSYKGVLWGKGVKLTARPGYEMLYMALTAEKPKKDILDSPYIAFDGTLVMHQNWFSSYSFQYRRDNSSLDDAGIDADNATSNQYYVKTAQTFLLDKSKQEALILNGGLMHNVAIGEHKTYNRVEAGATYARPVGTYAWNFGASYYFLTYPSADPHRQDDDLAITTGLSKPLKDWFTLGATATYTSNASSVSADQYSKFVIMTTATFTGMF